MVMIEEYKHRLRVRHGPEDSIEGTSFLVSEVCAVGRYSTSQATLATFGLAEEILQRDDRFSVGRKSRIIRLLGYKQGFFRVSRI